MIETIEDKKYPELADYCKKLLNDFLSKKIGQEEFDREICYTSLKYGFEELKYQSEPMAPQVILAYRLMDYQKKKSFLQSNDWFFREGEAANYIKALDHVEALNYRNYKHLLFMLDTMGFDLKALSRIQEKIYEYEDRGGFKQDQFRHLHHCNKTIKGES